MRPIEVALIAGSLCLFFFVNAKDGGPDGSWFELRQGERFGDARLALEIRRPGHRWRSENPRPWSGFRGITEADLRRDGPVKFEYVTDAGTVSGQGNVRGGRAKGEFTFKADPAFTAALRDAGYPPPGDNQIFELMMHGITLEFAKGVRASGLNANLRDLNELAVHGVTLDLVKEARALGFDRLGVGDFVEMRIHGVSSELMKAVKSAGYDIPMREIVEMRIHGISPEYLAEVKAAGVRPSARELVDMRIHGVSPDFLTGLAKAGYDNLKASEVVELRNHGVSADFAAHAKSLGYAFTTRELIEMRTHGVDARYLDKLADSGFKNLSAEKIVKLRSHGIE